MSARLRAWIPRLQAVERLRVSESTFGRYQRAGLVDWERDPDDGTVRIEMESLEALERALVIVNAERVASGQRLVRLAELTKRPIPPEAKLSEV